ncbi:MAG: hypothetical protein NC344_09560 [Bacteroidales bacterium]|nr:hypothetical protein [Bacteroidales bacterium]MCM1148052.1 hypothetical protein [Bacteroidales bacterium]MCM1207251.1 hypothetical protein [Bacillota bacterium]MCM1509494.1 hypothetical protein [Clostridium sp.]
MKKFLLGAILIASANSLYAQAESPESGNYRETVTEFWGSKASSNANNPCKGATIRICGTITTKLISDDVALVETIWLDENGNVEKQEMWVKEPADLKLDSDDVLPEIND